ncbi:hypothetical protein D3C81_2183710 [compost metagenome]
MRTHLDAGHGRQRHLRTGGCLDVEASEVFRAHAFAAAHLWDHIVGTIMKVEAVDVVLANQHRQGIGDRLHGHPHFAGPGIVDADVRL